MSAPSEQQVQARHHGGANGDAGETPQPPISPKHRRGGGIDHTLIALSCINHDTKGRPHRRPQLAPPAALRGTRELGTTEPQLVDVRSTHHGFIHTVLKRENIQLCALIQDNSCSALQQLHCDADGIQCMEAPQSIHTQSRPRSHHSHQPSISRPARWSSSPNSSELAAEIASSSSRMSCSSADCAGATSAASAAAAAAAASRFALISRAW